MNIERPLKIWYWSILAVTLLLALALWACGLSQTLAPNRQPVLFFVVSLSTVSYTLCAVPLALRLFRFRWVSRRLSSAYRRWALVRILLLGAAFMVNGVGFALSRQTSFFYLALITLVAMVFVYPSRQRCENEASTPNDTVA